MLRRSGLTPQESDDSCCGGTKVPFPDAVVVGTLREQMRPLLADADIQSIAQGNAVNRAMGCLGILSLAVLLGCATSKLVTQQSNPDYVGKSFKSVMVVGVAADEIVRRTFEDRVVALLDKRGLKGIPGYSVGSRGKVEEADLREVIARSGAEGVLITRVTRVDRQPGNVPGATVGVGLYGYYGGVWQTVTTAPQQISGPSWTLSETRLFDAKTGALAWTGIVDTKENDDLGAALTQYVHIIFDAMVSDRVL